MRETYLNPTLMVLLLGFSLASIGVGYGLWSKSLSIEGEVQTGDVDARWLFAGCFEFNTWPNFPIDEGDFGEAEGKSVGEWMVQVDPEDDQILHFTLSNVYPSYAVDCEVHYEVEGTIPVIVRGTTIVPGLGLANCAPLTGNQTKTLTCPELTVIFSDGIGSQLHAGDEMASSLRVHVEQPAEQGVSYGFDVLICMAQWNEAATAQECFDAAPEE